MYLKFKYLMQHFITVLNPHKKHDSEILIYYMIQITKKLQTIIGAAKFSKLHLNC